MKKVLVLLSLIVVMLFCSNIHASATEVTSKEAVNWIRKQAKKHKKFGYGQCVDLIESYYEFLGEKHEDLDGYEYITTHLPKGWKRVKNGKPKAGDIILFPKTRSCPWGHVAIYVGPNESYHQNFNGILHTVKCKYNIKKLSAPYWGYIRPKWGK